MALMQTHPSQTWTGRELAAALHVPQRNLLTQLARWAHTGFLTRTSPGTYALPAPP